MAAGGAGGETDIETGVNDFFKFSCSVCKSNKKNIEAEKFCIDCDDYFCLTCIKFHDAIRHLSAHKTVGKGFFIPEQCKRHQKSVYMYCQNHDTVGCSACMATDHSVCENVFLVPEFIEHNPHDANSSSAKQKLKTIIIKPKDIEHTLVQEIDRLLICKDDELEKIGNLRVQINTRLDELEKETITQLEGKFKLLIDKFGDGLRELTATLADVNNSLDSLQLTADNLSQNFVRFKKANEVSSHAEETVNKKNEEIMFADVYFTDEQRMVSLLNDMQTLGQISQREKYRDH